MSQPDANWPRWFKLSLVQSFRAVLGSDLAFFVEGMARRTDLQEYCEIRIDGPFFNEISKGYWCFDLTVDVLVVTNKDSADLARHERNVGIVLAGFNTRLPIMKYGDGADDNPLVQLGCLIPAPPPDGEIRVTNFGQVRPDSRVIQSTVEQSFQMNLIT